jgi:hypothetical protein
VAQTVAHAQAVGRELGAAGLTLARLAYDVGSVLAEAGRSLVGGTIRAAEGLARREDATGDRATAPQRDGNTGDSGAEAAAPPRKSLARAGTAPARRRRRA